VSGYYACGQKRCERGLGLGPVRTAIVARALHSFNGRSDITTGSEMMTVERFASANATSAYDNECEHAVRVSFGQGDATARVSSRSGKDSLRKGS
jgi:hypothetical protein